MSWQSRKPDHVPGAYTAETDLPPPVNLPTEFKRRAVQLVIEGTGSARSKPLVIDAD